MWKKYSYKSELKNILYYNFFYKETLMVKWFVTLKNSKY